MMRLKNGQRYAKLKNELRMLQQRKGSGHRKIKGAHRGGGVPEESG
jgi:hypothetical protein